MLYLFSENGRLFDPSQHWADKWKKLSFGSLKKMAMKGQNSKNTTNLQQTTLNIFCQNIENLYKWMDNLWLKVENIVAKGEIACFEQFLLLSLRFQKAVCCRGVRKCLYEGKG